MNNLLFKKKQEPSSQLCKCSLASADGAKGQKGEKFLAKLQAQSSKVNIQVNTPNKVMNNKKKKQSKQSLRSKEKKREILPHFPAKGFNASNIPYLQTFPQYSYYLPIVGNQNKTSLQSVKNRNQINQYTFIKQNYHTQEPNQIRVESRQQHLIKYAKTQRSTHCSNDNQFQLKSSLQFPSSQLNDRYFVKTATISVIQPKQAEYEQTNCLPRSKSFSLNLKRIASQLDKNLKEIKQSVLDHKRFIEQSNQIQPCNLRLGDLMFKSAESFQQGSSDQYSELASQSQYQYNLNVNQNKWSQSLNQIFVKKLRRMSHNINS